VHRILLRKFFIDAPAEVHDRTRDFWATALAAQPHQGVKYPEYHWFEHPAALMQVFVQDIGPASARYHVDIETDDIEAEVTRLLAAGAEVVDRQDGWVVLRDPAGLLFCVVPAEGDGFAEKSTVVED
jgi:catechol 2,3-dioxygenase-like lactoylglutathione lyase family enzyme